MTDDELIQSWLINEVKIIHDTALLKKDVLFQSYDDLIPVIEIIYHVLDKTKQEDFFISMNRCCITGNESRNLIDVRAKTTLQAVRMAILQFIKYNENKH